MVRSANSLRVLVVSQYYPPEGHGAIPASIARGLSGRGHDVQVVTAFPSHPHGRLFEGWRRRLGHVERDGDVTVRRVPTFIDHSDRAVRRVLSYLSFAVSSVAATAVARRADVVHVYCAQPTAAIAPLLWKCLFGTPYVLHVQDVWPESVAGSGIVTDGRAARVMSGMILAGLRRLHRRAAHVVAIAPGAASLLVERGAAVHRTSTILNWATTTAPQRPPHRGGSGTRIVYAGNLGPNQGLDTVVRAAARCRDLPELRFVFIGEGLAAGRLVALATELGADNVEFRPAVPRARMSAVHADADFEIVALADAPMSAITVPSKLQDALAHGVPVIAALPGDAADLVRNRRAGFVVPPGDVDALEAAFRAAHASDAGARAHMADAAAAVVARQMHADTAIDHLEQILRKAAQ